MKIIIRAIFDHNKFKSSKKTFRAEAEARLEAGSTREKRLVDKVHYLEERVLNRSSEESSDADERTSLQTARHGLEVTRQQLSALSARLQVNAL